MQLSSDDARRYVLHQQLACRWIREGGVVIATESARGADRPTFDFAETVVVGASLQVTFNLREVGKACKFLSDYAVYLWKCDHEGEYFLCGSAENGAYAFDTSYDAARARAYRRVAAACYAGRFPKLRLDIYDAEVCKPSVMSAAIMTRMLLPRGVCAAIYQNLPSGATAKRSDHANEPAAWNSLSGATASLRASFPRSPQTIAQDA